MQNKASIAANATQHQIVQESAERQRQEDKAGKQLERVQLQMAEFVRPLNAHVSAWHHAWIHASEELGFSHNNLYSVEFVAQPATPRIQILNTNNPAGWNANGRMPYYKLAPEDVTLLESNPAKRERYSELVAHCMLPPLRHLTEMLATKRHLNESVKPQQLATNMPQFGRDFSFLGTTSDIYSHSVQYAAEFESVAARWARDDWGMLEPATPSPHIWLLMLFIEVLKAVGAKEVTLLGAAHSSASRVFKIARTVDET